MAKLYLTNGTAVLVDDEDLERLLPYKWAEHRTTDHLTSYARAEVNGKKDRRLMHRMILDAPRGSDIDHINGDGLDNRKVNLRLATRSQNMHNQRNRRNNTSGFKGVTLDSRNGRWRGRVMLERRSVSLGYFATKEEAAAVVRAARQKLHGDFANDG